MESQNPIHTTHRCGRCNRENRIVNECRCDPNNLPTAVPPPGRPGKTLKPGEAWKSQCINHAFVIDGGEETWPGLGEWSKEKFTGHRAKREGDGRLSLVALSAKPKGYPYDYVLFDSASGPPGNPDQEPEEQP